MRILAVCGMGLGSSMILKINIQNALKELGVPDVAVDHCDLNSLAFEKADLIVVTRDLQANCERYGQVIDAFFAGLEQAGQAGRDPASIASVASFFVSRVDTEVDKRLDVLIASAPAELVEHLKALQGRSAIANAKLTAATITEEGAFLEAQLTQLRTTTDQLITMIEAIKGK